MGREEVRFAASEAETRLVGASLARELSVGDVVLLDGPLGAGKTTLVRGLLEELGFSDPVRSPTFNLIQTFQTQPPVMHADLYRVASYQGIGIEDYLDTHVCLIEWPDRAVGLIDPALAWRVEIGFEGEGRSITVWRPSLEK